MTRALAPLTLGLLLSGLLPALAQAPVQSPVSAPAPAEVRATVERALPLIQRAAAGYVRQRGCFSCHHQAMSVLALTAARRRGYGVPEAALREQVTHTETFLRGNRDNYRQGKGQGGQVTTAGYGLWTLDAGGWQPDDTTAAIAEYLLRREADRDHWTAVSTRPPSEASPFTDTYVALRGLRRYGTAEQRPRIDARVEKALAWLRGAPARENEDRVFRLRALQAAGADAAAVQSAAAELVGAQRPDGGWSQLDGRESDAYATGTALAALREAGGLATDDPSYGRGVSYLVRSQLPDGSWLVTSRSLPFQPYFESGFPHSKDQWISMSASCWAVVALAEAVPGK